MYNCNEVNGNCDLFSSRKTQTRLSDGINILLILRDEPNRHITHIYHSVVPTIFFLNSVFVD